MIRSVLMLALDAATVAVPPEATTCAQADPNQIVVCGRAVDPGRYRLPRSPSAEAPTGPPRAEWGLGGGVRVGAGVQSGAMPQGAISKRAMVTVKIPF